MTSSREGAILAPRPNDRGLGDQLIALFVITTKVEQRSQRGGLTRTIGSEEPGHGPWFGVGSQRSGPGSSHGCAISRPVTERPGSCRRTGPDASSGLGGSRHVGDREADRPGPFTR